MSNKNKLKHKPACDWCRECNECAKVLRCECRRLCCDVVGGTCKWLTARDEKKKEVIIKIEGSENPPKADAEDEHVVIEAYFTGIAQFAIPKYIKLLSVKDNDPDSNKPFSWYVRWSNLYYIDKDGVEQEIEAKLEQDIKMYEHPERVYFLNELEYECRDYKCCPNCNHSPESDDDGSDSSK